MKRLLLILLSLMAIPIFVGCSAQSQEPFSQLNMDEADQEVKQFVQRVEENGIYLFGNKLDADQYYVLLDGVDRKKKKEHIYFKDVYAEIQDGTLKIFYSEASKSQAGQNQLLFKIDKNQFQQEYDNIKLFKDNQDTDFTSIVVQGETP